MMISSTPTISFGKSAQTNTHKRKSDTRQNVNIAEGVGITAVGVVKGEKIASKVWRGATRILKGTGNIAQKGTVLQPGLLKYFKKSKFEFFNKIAANPGMQKMGKLFVGGTALAVVGADVDNIGKTLFGNKHNKD